MRTGIKIRKHGLLRHLARSIRRDAFTATIGSLDCNDMWQLGHDGTIQTRHGIAHREFSSGQSVNERKRNAGICKIFFFETQCRYLSKIKFKKTLSIYIIYFIFLKVASTLRSLRGKLPGRFFHSNVTPPPAVCSPVISEPRSPRPSQPRSAAAC